MLFVIPMMVYGIGFLRTLVFLLLIVVIRAGGAFGLRQVVLNMPDVPWLPHSSQALSRELARDPLHFYKRLAGMDAPDEIDRMLDDALVPLGPTPSLRDRQAMVAVLQQKLQARKATFPPGVPPPPAFQKQMDRYEKFLNEVKADMAQPHPQGTASALIALGRGRGKAPETGRELPTTERRGLFDPSSNPIMRGWNVIPGLVRTHVFCSLAPHATRFSWGKVTTVNVPVSPPPFHPRFFEFLQRPEFKHMLWAFVVSIVIAQVIKICAYWISSKAVAQRDKSTWALALAVVGKSIPLPRVAVAWPFAMLFLVPFLALFVSSTTAFGAYLVIGGTVSATIFVGLHSFR